MTSYSDRGERPDEGHFIGFDHMHFWVGNALQAAAYFICRFGFQPYAYRGLETGSRTVMTQVVRQNDVLFAFSSALEPRDDDITRHVAVHGDSVRDIALRVTNCKAIFDRAIAAGASAVMHPTVHENSDGRCVIATIATPHDDTLHTFVDRSDFHGVFLPGFEPADDAEPQLDLVPPVDLKFIDHCVTNHPDRGMEPVVQWYIDTLSFHRFWSVDDNQLHTEYSSLRSVVVADYDERVKIPINEPAAGKRKSQIQEFVDYYGGSGVQHIALRTDDIITSVSRLRQRGVSFIRVPDNYYDDLRQRLAVSNTRIKEDIDQLRKLAILVDFDEKGYLLQIFTKPVVDRPTVFVEIIQRRAHNGFGAGNFKSLFEAIEREQALRGNL